MTITFAPAEAQQQRAETSAVCSHQSYERSVHALCHHSGQYLTLEETNPDRVWLFREQHDFPGFKELDDRFQKAAHAREHQHLMWSEPALRGGALLAGGALVLYGVSMAWTRSGQWANLFEGVLIFTLLIVGFLGALGMMGAGIWQIQSRNELFHRQALGQRPAVDDFPLFGSYSVEISEVYEQDLVNERRKKPVLRSLTGKVVVKVRPEPEAPQTYQTYQSLYGMHRHAGIGTHLFAGALALEGLKWIRFRSPVDYDHRIVLRQPVDEQFVVNGEPRREPISFHTEYAVQPEAMRVNRGTPHERPVLAVTARLDGFDSYTLVVTFTWAGRPAKLVLEECRLTIPPELGGIEYVEYGRRVKENGVVEALWRNMVVEPEQPLSLKVRFKQPLLGKGAPEKLHGSYRMIAATAISGIEVSPRRIWDALGRNLPEHLQPVISAVSECKGQLEIRIALLAQEHEHVATERVQIAHEPDSELVSQLAEILTKMGVSIQRIEEALPRLDPGGALQYQLRYWDILGRQYELQELAALDVHVVVSGSTGSQRAAAPPTLVDVRVRCLHDPRSPQIAERAEHVCKAIAGKLATLSDQAGASARVLASSDGGNG